MVKASVFPTPRAPNIALKLRACKKTGSVRTASSDIADSQAPTIVDISLLCTHGHERPRSSSIIDRPAVLRSSDKARTPRQSQTIERGSGNAPDPRLGSGEQRRRKRLRTAFSPLLHTAALPPCPEPPPSLLPAEKFLLHKLFRNILPFEHP